MRLSGEEYSKRLAEYSDDTIRLISRINPIRELQTQLSEITTNSELTEEEVVEKLQELLRSSETRKTPTSR